MDEGDTAADQSSDSDSDLSASDPDTPEKESSSAKQQKLSSKVSAAAEQQPSQQEDLGPDAELQEFQNVQERREELKQQMAVTASKLLQNPEANLPTLRSLLSLAADKDAQVHGYPSWYHQCSFAYLEQWYGTLIERGAL